MFVSFEVMKYFFCSSQELRHLIILDEEEEFRSKINQLKAELKVLLQQVETDDWFLSYIVFSNCVLQDDCVKWTADTSVL